MTNDEDFITNHTLAVREGAKLIKQGRPEAGVVFALLAIADAIETASTSN
jgi:uncharacterized UPF0146 family protein